MYVPFPNDRQAASTTRSYRTSAWPTGRPCEWRDDCVRPTFAGPTSGDFRRSPQRSATVHPSPSTTAQHRGARTVGRWQETVASMAEEPSAASSSQSSTDEEVAALYQHARSAVPAIVVVDRINKQDNIGGIVRSASALGVTHLCFVGASRDDGRRAHIGHQSSKPARVPYAHMTAAQLNLCFHDKATRSAPNRHCPSAASTLRCLSGAPHTRSTAVRAVSAASLAFRTSSPAVPLSVRWATRW